MFEQLQFGEKAMVYRGLLCLVQSNSGIGFYNGDQGHPAYALGKEGKYDFQMFGDSPEHNRMFKMMNELTIALSESDADESSEIGEFIYSWSDFCRLAYTAYERHKKIRE